MMKHYRFSDKPKLFFSICVNPQNTLHISTDLRLLCPFPTRRLEQCSSYWYSGLKANMLSVLWLWQFCLTHCMACSCGRSFVYNFKEMRKCSVPCRSFPSSVAAWKREALPEACRRAVPVFCWGRGCCRPAGTWTNGSGRSLTADALVLHYEASETKTSRLPQQLCYGHRTWVWRIGGNGCFSSKLTFSPPDEWYWQ